MTDVAAAVVGAAPIIKVEGPTGGKEKSQNKSKNKVVNKALLEKYVKEDEDQIPTYSCLTYFVACFGIASVFSTISICIWSSMGIGEDSMKFIEDRDYLPVYILLGIDVGLGSILYYADFFAPPHIPGKYLLLWPEDRCFGRCCFLICVVCFLTACLFSAKDYPGMPMLITTFLSPACVLVFRVVTNSSSIEECCADDLMALDLHSRMKVLKKLTGGERDAKVFYKAAMFAYLLCSFICLAVWLPWAFQQKDDFKTLSDKSAGEREKEKLYILWCTPLATAASNFVFFLLIGLRVLMARSYESTSNAKNNLIIDATIHKHELTPEEVEAAKEAKLQASRGATSVVVDDNASSELQTECARRQTAHLRQLSRIIKIIGSAMLFMIGTFYVASELVAADSHISSVVQWFLGAFFITFFAFLLVSFRRLLRAMSDEIVEMPLFRMAKSAAESDWVKALGVAGALPIIPGILAISCVNQSIRRRRGILTNDSVSQIPSGMVPRGETIVEQDPIQLESHNGSMLSPVASPSSQKEVSCKQSHKGSMLSAVASCKKEVSCKQSASMISATQKEEPKLKIVVRTDEDRWLTKRVQAVVDAMREWNWITMTRKLYILGLVLVIYQLSPRLLNIFLAWLNSLLKKLDFGLILIMVWVSGMGCFLLPPVPGVPVYVFAGMIIADQCPQGFWPGALIAIGLSFIMKLCACAMQQKLIGEALGSWTSIQQQVGIHKSLIRATDVLLRQDGFTVGKVAILCGGPDWPTSVLAGVLRLPLLQMLLGTTPIIIFIGPCVLTGAFYLKQEESELWERSGVLLLTLTVVISLVLWAIVGYVFQDQFDNNFEFISRPMEKYLELDWRDYRQEQLANCRVVTMKDAPLPLRILYVGLMVVLILVGHVFYWRPTDCFGEFKVTDDIKNLKWKGKDGIFKDPGLYGCIIAASCLIGWIIFGKWLGLQTNAVRKAKAAELAQVEERWKEARRKLCKEAAEAAASGKPMKVPLFKIYSRLIDKE